MLKSLYCFLAFSFLFFHSIAQHADLGTGNLRNQIWWFDWAGFTMTNGASRTFTTDGDLVVTATFSNVSTFVPAPSVMNTWSGAILYKLYDFSNTAIMPALYRNTNTIGETSNFTITFTAKRNGLAVPFRILTSEAEGSSIEEITTFHTSGTNWETLDFYRTSSQTTNPITGCGTPTVVMSDTYGGGSGLGQIPVMSTTSAAGSPIAIDIKFDHTTTYGGMAVAFGIYESVDRGDLPASYGTVQHDLGYTVINSCNTTAPLPGVTQISNFQIGAIHADADAIQYTDDNLYNTADEDGVTNFPAYDGSGSYSVQVAVGNASGGNTYLTGWFDYNRNGQFDAGESVTRTIPVGATNTTVTWSGLPVYLPKGTATGYGFRFRMSSDLAATQQATGWAKDGETEDYFIPSAVLCYMLPVSISNDTSICAGSPVPLHATGGSTYTWSPTTDLSDPAIADPIATPVLSTVYSVTIENLQGCSQSLAVNITTHTRPTLTVSNDTTICKGQPVSLLASGASTYTWTSSDGSTHASGPVLQQIPQMNTKYYVNGLDPGGCSADDSVQVTVHALGSFGWAPAAPYICKDQPIILHASGGDTYTWLSPTNTLLGTSDTLTVAPSQDETYQVTISDIICQVTQTLAVPILVKPPFATQVSKSNDIDCTLGQATLKATGGIAYRWDSIPGISDLHISNPVVAAPTTTMYYVTITGANGCPQRDSVEVITDFQSALSKYPVPTAFTPNNDGNNDCFHIKYWGQVTVLSLEVFDRWGSRVFYTNNVNDCWNGMFNGNPMPAGTYIYQIKASTRCGTAYRKGTVMLIR